MSGIRIAIALAFLLLVATGCGVRGTWVLCPDQPPAAGCEYAFNKITFNAAGSFQAETRLDGRRVRAAGTYEYDSDHELLTIRTGGRELVYKLRVPDDNRIVFMDQRDDGTVVKTTMLRQQPCPDCATCGPCGAMYRKYRPQPEGDFALRPTTTAVSSANIHPGPACPCSRQ